MEEFFLQSLICPVCRSNLKLMGDKLICSNNHEFIIKDGIPRFVETDKYVSSFSIEWQKNPVTQYDEEFPSKNNFNPEFVPAEQYSKDFDNAWRAHPFTTSWDIENKSETYDSFYIKTGFRPEELKGKRVLEIGCGNGRFLDVLSNAGAICYGIDLSYSVEVAYKNLKDRGNVFIVQGDINSPPFKDDYFDLVYSIGVLHHTPSVEEAIRNISKLVKLDHYLAIWIYGKNLGKNLRHFWWSILKHLPKNLLYYICRSSKWLYFIYRIPIIGYIRFFFPIAMSPDPKIRIQSTFDSYSPEYDYFTAYPELIEFMKKAGYTEVEIGVFPTSARGKRII